MVIPNTHPSNLSSQNLCTDGLIVCQALPNSNPENAWIIGGTVMFLGCNFELHTDP